MKDTINTFANWRAAALVLVAVLAIICFAADADNVAVFFGVKAIGVFLAFCTYLLFRYWNKHGLMDEIKRLANE